LSEIGSRWDVATPFISSDFFVMISSFNIRFLFAMPTRIIYTSSAMFRKSLSTSQKESHDRAETFFYLSKKRNLLNLNCEKPFDSRLRQGLICARAVLYLLKGQVAGPVVARF
jgi:hypothetical protein